MRRNTVVLAEQWKRSKAASMMYDTHLAASLCHGLNRLEHHIRALLEVQPPYPAQQGYLGVHIKAQLLLQGCFALGLACVTFIPPVGDSCIL